MATATQTPAPVPTIKETITIPVDDLNALVELKIEERLKALQAEAEAKNAPPPPVPLGPRWVFLHESAPGFALPLPPDLKAKTGDGYIRFKPDIVDRKSRYRPRRGRYSTSDPAIGEWLLGKVQRGEVKGVVVDSEATRLKLQQDEIAYLSA